MPSSPKSTDRKGQSSRRHALRSVDNEEKELFDKDALDRINKEQWRIKREKAKADKLAREEASKQTPGSQTQEPGPSSQPRISFQPPQASTSSSATAGIPDEYSPPPPRNPHYQSNPELDDVFEDAQEGASASSASPVSSPGQTATRSPARSDSNNPSPRREIQFADQTTVRVSSIYSLPSSPVKQNYFQHFPGTFVDFHQFQESIQEKARQPSSPIGSNMGDPPVVQVNSAVYIPGLICDGKEINHFFEQFSNLIALNGWDDKRTLGNFLMHLQGPALHCYNSYIEQKLIEKDKKTVNDLDDADKPTFSEVKKLLLDNFGREETPESIIRQANQITRSKCVSAAAYYYAKMSLLGKLKFPNTKEGKQRYIPHLIRGLSRQAAEHIYMQDPLEPEAFLTELKKYEKVHNIMGTSDTVNLTVENSVSSLEKEMRRILDNLFNEKKEEMNLLIKGNQKGSPPLLTDSNNGSTTAAPGYYNRKKKGIGHSQKGGYNNNKWQKNRNWKNDKRYGKNPITFAPHININPPQYGRKHNYNSGYKGGNRRQRNDRPYQGHGKPSLKWKDTPDTHNFQSSITCYNCRELGHVARSCPHLVRA